jgi:hypothetical protein
LGDVNAGTIDTTELIDPFFFSATDIAEPASWSLILMGLAGTAWLRRRPPVRLAGLLQLTRKWKVRGGN